MKKACAAVLSALALVGAATTDVRAVDLRNVLTDYTFTSWTRKDGLAGPVWAIAQDAEGFLWLGTDDGVVRFDGVRFVPWDRLGAPLLPHLTVRSLHVANDRSLWVGFGATGGIARIQGQTVRVYGEAEGASTGAVTAMAEDRRHTIWVAAANGLFRLVDDRWQRLGSAQGLPEVAATNVYVDSSDTPWVGTAAGLYWRPEPTNDTFQQIDPASDPVRALSLSEDETGRMWTSDPLVGFRTLGFRTTPASAEAGRGYRLLHDRQGSLWVGTIGQGLWRVRHSTDPERATIEKTTVLSGLSSDAVRSVFEDRDGNIWAGTTEGVDRLVPHRITPWTGLGLVGTIAAADARVWVGTSDGIIRFSRAATAWQPDQTRIPMRGVRDLRIDGDGIVWTVSSDGLLRIDGTHASRVPLPPGVNGANIEALAGSRQSGVWVVAAGGVVFRVEGPRLTLFNQVSGLKDTPVTSALVDTSGRLWLALSGAQIGVLSGPGQFKIYGPQDGLGPGPHFEIYEDAESSMWICGADGLSRLSGDRFHVVARANGLPAGGVLGVTEDDEHNLWLATSAGIIRLARSEFDAAAANATYQLHFRTYDTSDGLAGFPVLAGDRNGIRASDGTLWFVTSRGLSVVEPRALGIGRTMPRVALDDIEVNDRPFAEASHALSAGASKLEISYTVPELTYPLKMRFRYRLDGFDAGWVEAGNRRQALYTNLPPGQYAFHVDVSGDEGRWSDAGATWAFSIAPRIYQTWGFYGAVALMLAAMVWGAWEFRVRQLRRQFSLVLGERVRLSRELHDTLLQSLVGVALEFDAVSKSLEGSPDVAKARVVRIRERVEEYIREARRSIWSLRSHALETGDLVEALREGAARATSDQSVELEFSVSGVPQRYRSDVEHQLMRIGQEAVLNAARHADAHTIRMHVDFGSDAVALRVADDGRGFDVNHGAEGTTDHYGITTMRERAEQVGGHVTITSEPGRGTVVEAVVPIARAEPEGVSA